MPVTKKQLTSAGLQAAINDSHLVEMAKAVRDAIVEDLPEHLAKQIGPYLEDNQVKIKSYIAHALEREVGVLNKRLDDSDAKLLNMEASYAKQLNEMKSFYQNGLANMKEFIKALPPPIINLPEMSPTFNVKPAVVNVPDGAIKNIVQIPLRKSIVEKSVVYDTATGRPSKIKEETTEEEVK